MQHLILMNHYSSDPGRGGEYIIIGRFPINQKVLFKVDGHEAEA